MYKLCSTNIQWKWWELEQKMWEMSFGIWTFRVFMRYFLAQLYMREKVFWCWHNCHMWMNHSSCKSNNSQNFRNDSYETTLQKRNLQRLCKGLLWLVLLFAWAPLVYLPLRRLFVSMPTVKKRSPMSCLCLLLQLIRKEKRVGEGA